MTNFSYALLRVGLQSPFMIFSFYVAIFLMTPVTGREFPSAWIDEVVVDTEITDGFYTEFKTLVDGSCTCKALCFMTPNCVSFSYNFATLTCRHSDHVPSASEIRDSLDAVYAFHDEYVSNPGSNSATTIAPSTTIDPTTYVLKFMKEESCTASRAISTVSMKPEEPKRSYLMYTVCFRPMIGADFKIDDSDVEYVATGPNDNSAECTSNRVLVDFVGYSDSTYGDEDSRDNPIFMLGTCHLLVNWVVDYDDCEVLTPVTTPWTLLAEPNAETEKWDYWISCQPFFLAIQITRQLNGAENELASMKCCRIIG